MPSLSKKDRVSLCSFTFSDGRRCRTPRIGNHPHFCFYHAQKEARARAAEKLGKDLAYFFSGDYLSACDLSTALARLIPAVVRGDVKPRTARTVAYLAQTLLQAIHISQDEYINAFDTDGWRKSVRNSVNSNHDHLFPPKPKQPESPQPQPAAVAHAGIYPGTAGRGEAFGPAQPQTQAQQPTSAPPANSPPPAAQPAETPVNCHSEPARGGRSKESAFSESQPDLSQIIPAPPQTPSPTPTQPPPTLAPATSPTPSPTRPNNPPRTGPPTPQPAPNRNAFALHFDHNCRLLLDGKPL